MSRWKEIERVRCAFPRGSGVYVVYHDDIVYVGSSTDLSKRCRVYWKKPRSNKWEYDIGDTPVRERKQWRTPFGFVAAESIRIKVKRSRRIGDWLMWEYRLIRRLQPEWNRAGVKG